MISRPEAIKLLLRHRTDEIVVSAFRASQEWVTYKEGDDLHFPTFYSMGLAPSFGLGIALARPDRRVWALNGDGSQLMFLGGLATIAQVGPKNLVVFVFENGVYETTGEQPIPMSGRVDFAAAARGLGIQNSHSFDELSSLEAELPRILQSEGPTFVVLKVVKGAPPRPGFPDQEREMRKLMRALQGQA